MRSWLVALAAAAILSTACGAGTPTTIDPTIQSNTPTATPPRRMVMSAASDGVQPTDTPTATPTPIPPTEIPYVPPTRVPVAYAQAAPVQPVGNYAGLICSYSWPCSQALAVAQCESGMNAAAVSPVGAVGLFQIHPYNAGNFDPGTNVAAAYAKYLYGVSLGNPWREWNSFGGCGNFG